MNTCHKIRMLISMKLMEEITKEKNVTFDHVKVQGVITKKTKQTKTIHKKYINHKRYFPCKC